MTIVKHVLYLCYLLKHKVYVVIAGRRLGVPWKRLIVHDLSKFSTAEWFPYAAYFYGHRRSSEVRRSFDIAWLYHQLRNEHHWQYHIPGFHMLTVDDAMPCPAPYLIPDCGSARCLYCGMTAPKDTLAVPRKPMPEVVVREMVADWAAAHKCNGGKDLRGWYKQNHDEILLHPETRTLVTKLIAEVSGPES